MIKYIQFIKAISVNVFDVLQLIVGGKVTFLFLKCQITIVAEEHEVGGRRSINIYKNVNITIMVEVLVYNLLDIAVGKQCLLVIFCARRSNLQYDVGTVIADIVQFTVTIEVAGEKRSFLVADKIFVVSITIEHPGVTVQQV